MVVEERFEFTVNSCIDRSFTSKKMIFSRWFILRPQTGHLEYYLMEESNQGKPIIGKHRGSQPLVGTNVIPSDEDSQAFSVVFASGKNAILVTNYNKVDVTVIIRC